MALKGYWNAYSVDSDEYPRLGGYPFRAVFLLQSSKVEIKLIVQLVLRRAFHTYGYLYWVGHLLSPSEEIQY